MKEASSRKTCQVHFTHDELLALLVPQIKGCPPNPTVTFHAWPRAGATVTWTEAEK